MEKSNSAQKELMHQMRMYYMHQRPFDVNLGNTEFSITLHAAECEKVWSNLGWLYGKSSEEIHNIVIDAHLNPNDDLIEFIDNTHNNNNTELTFDEDDILIINNVLNLDTEEFIKSLDRIIEDSENNMEEKYVNIQNIEEPENKSDFWMLGALSLMISTPIFSQKIWERKVYFLAVLFYENGLFVIGKLIPKGSLVFPGTLFCTRRRRGLVAASGRPRRESNPAGLVFGGLLFVNLVFIFWSLLGVDFDWIVEIKIYLLLLSYFCILETSSGFKITDSSRQDPTYVFPTSSADIITCIVSISFMLNTCNQLYRAARSKCEEIAYKA
ncbi:hypothetical protein C1645_828903 [Glomus cerebriforme]|uniref:Uncharacterized protein n=1 Tax=Glomus cerebriforme TaxID=658196 RepID=A0A397SRV7_9GLOM|nr:hypothetical protein C1645_828903 [Glomus cerebriforme]